MECTVCGKKAVYTYRYNGTSACREHFMQGFEKRVRQEIRKQIVFRKPKTRISVAISGGKDSSVTLYILKKILGERKDVVLSAFTVDEGIEGYRDSGLKASIDLCRSLGIRHDVKSYSEVFGTTMDRVVKEDPDTIPCARCGPMRRELINELSRIQEGDYVALGLNLDDYAQSVLMNVVRGDLKKMSRMAPHTTEKEGLVRRILPLRKIPEKEVVVYATLAGIPFDHSWCPYYGRAQRNTFREILQKLEERSPGAKFGIVRFSDDLRSTITSEVYTDIGKCKYCGAPTSAEVCAVCSKKRIIPDNFEQS
jgi:uncharacterized protein (TIGR00269 family)